MKKSFLGSIKGPALPATIYVIVYTLYIIAFSFQFGVYLIRPFYLIFYSISFWYLYKVTQLKGNSSFIRALTFFFSLICLYGVLLLITGTAGWGHKFDSSTFLVSHIQSIVPIYVFYYFGRRGFLSSPWFRIMFVLFCVEAYALFHAGQWQMKNIMLSAGFDVDEGFTNNSGYVVVSLLPLIAFFNKKRTIQYAALIIIAIGTIICYKRGAMLVGVIAILYFLKETLKAQNQTRKISIIVLSLLAFYALYMYVEQLYSSNYYFYSRMSVVAEGDTSGRDNIWTFFWNFFISKENGIGIIIGNGANATVRLHGIEAHSDWFEYAIDMGLVGVISFVFFWKTAYGYYKKASHSLPIDYVLAMGMVLLINFVRTFFSMSFNDMSFFCTALIGYTMAMVDNYKRRQVNLTNNDRQYGKCKNGSAATIN